MAEWSSPPTRRKQHSRVGAGSLAKNASWSSSSRGSGSIMVNQQSSGRGGGQEEQAWELPTTREGPYGDGSHVKRRLVLLEGGEQEVVKREPGIVAKLMGLEPPIPNKPVPMAVAAPAASGGGQVRQLQELLRIREPFLLQELLLRDELEERPAASAATAVGSTLRERLVHLVKRERPSSSISKLKTTKKAETGVILLSPRRTAAAAGVGPSRSAPSSPIKRGLTVEPAVKIVETNSVAGQRVCSSSSSSPSSSSCSASRSSAVVDTSSSCSSSAPSSSCRELPTFDSGGSNHRRRFSLSRSSSEPTMQVGKKQSGLARLSENLSKRFGNKKPTPSPASEAKKSGGLHRSKSDLGLSSSSKLLPSRTEPKKTVYSSSSSSSSSAGPSFNPVKEAMRSIFGHRRKSHQQQQPVHKEVEPSSSLVRSFLRKRNASPKPSSIIDPKPVAKKKLEFEDFDQEHSPTSHRSRTESGQPSPVSVLDAPFSDEAHSSSSSSGDDSPEKPRQEVVDEAVGSDSILSAILDISRIRRIDLSSIGIEPVDQHSDDDLQCIEEVLSTSRSQYQTGDEWYAQGLPIVNTSRDQLLVDCIDDAIEARLYSLRLAMRMPWAGQRRRLSPPRPSTVTKQVYDQISEWKSMATRPMDELVGRDMNVGPGRWSDWSDQVDALGRDVARDILDSLVDELVVVTRCSIVNSTC